MRAPLLALLAALGGLAGCSRDDAPGGALRSIRSTFNPPAPPPDTIPEMLDYAPDLQVNLADMAKLPEGVLWQDVVAGDSLAAAVAPGDSVEIGFDGWLPDGAKVDSGVVALRVGSGAAIAGIDLALPGMRQGGRRKLVLTPGLAFGTEGAGAIPPGAVLVYDLVVRAIFR